VADRLGGQEWAAEELVDSGVTFLRFRNQPGNIRNPVSCLGIGAFCRNPRQISGKPISFLLYSVNFSPPLRAGVTGPEFSRMCRVLQECQQESTELQHGENGWARASGRQRATGRRESKECHTPRRGIKHRGQ